LETLRVIKRLGQRSPRPWIFRRRFRKSARHSEAFLPSFRFAIQLPPQMKHIRVLAPLWRDAPELSVRFGRIAKVKPAFGRTQMVQLGDRHRFHSGRIRAPRAGARQSRAAIRIAALGRGYVVLDQPQPCAASQVSGI
jgi:hypothetical protein